MRRIALYTTGQGKEQGSGQLWVDDTAYPIEDGRVSSSLSRSGNDRSERDRKAFQV